MPHVNVSVIIPVYGVEKYVECCIKSVLGQTMQDGVEVIIVNDCTPDRSMEKITELLRCYKERMGKMVVRIVNHDTNRGLAAARNTGVSQATGDYIIHCDSDDWVEPAMYSELYSKAIETGADIVVCDYWEEYSAKRARCYQEVKDREEFITKTLNGKVHCGMWNKLVKRSLYDKLDFLWVDGINMWEDVSVMCRLAYYAEHISCVDEALYHYNLTNENAYTQVWGKAALENLVKATDIVYSFYQEKGGAFRNDIELFRLRAKVILSFRSSSQDKRVYKKLYPETDRLIFIYPALFIYNKVLMWCWFHSLYKLADALKSMVISIKKMTKR